jgi:hypothetical protein
VRLPAVPARKRLIPKDEQRISREARVGDKKPFPLTDKGSVPSPETFLAGESQRFLSRPDLLWLERHFCACDRAHRLSFWNCRYEPVFLVVTAEKLLLGQELPPLIELPAEQN